MFTTNSLPLAAPAPPVAPPAVTLSPVAVAPPADRFADLDAERRLLAAILRDPALLPPLVGSVIVSEFFLVAHRHIFAACLDLCDQSPSFSLSTLETTLAYQNHPDSLAIVRDLLAQPPAPIDAVFDQKAELASYVHRIRDKAQERRLLEWLETAHSRFLNGASMTEMRYKAASLFNASLPAPITGYHGSLRQVLCADIKETEVIMPGLHRGEVAELLADEAQGKTSLLLQLALSLTAGEAISPLLSAPADNPLKVVYINGDAAASRLRNEFQDLLPTLANQEQALDNLRVVFEGQLDGRPVTLQDGENWQRLANWLRLQEMDLLILDGVPALDTEASKPSQRREQGNKVLAKLRELAKQTKCAILVAHSTVSNGNRRRLGNALFASADVVYHFRSDHRYREDVRQFRCVQSRWKVPEVQDLQRNLESGGYEVMQEAARQAIQTPSILELVEFIDKKRWVEANQITQHFEERATPNQVAKLIREAHLLGWIFRRHLNMPWQLDKRGEAYIAEKKAKADADAKKSADIKMAEEARNNNANVELIKNSANKPDSAIEIKNDANTEAGVEAKEENRANADVGISKRKNFSADTEISMKN